MVQITVRVDGMACSMCEAHVSDAIRKAFPVKKVTASHTKGQAVIVAENEIAEADIAKALEPTGYRMVSYSCAPYQKKKLFGIFGCLPNPCASSSGRAATRCSAGFLFVFSIL